MDNLRQLKLTTGDEVICEVLEWPDNELADMLVRNVLQLVPRLTSNGDMYFAFRSWIVGGESADFISLNANHIVGEMAPRKKIASYYKQQLLALAEETKNDEQSLDDLIEEELINDDTSSTEENIIKLFDRKKLH